MAHLLDEQFNGIGEVRGFLFLQRNSSNKAYLYEVMESDDSIHFEVFIKKTVPLCIDFVNRVYSDTELKECYPKSNDFGNWAWTFKDYQMVIIKFNSLSL
jgi:hypothetical protein